MKPLKNPVLKHQNAKINEETQKILNKPLKDQNGFSQEDQEFLAIILEKVEKEEINLMVPSSILNEKAYNKLSLEKKALVETEAFNLLTSVRDIHSLYQYESQATFQIKNMIHQVRLTKERLEMEEGDIFII